jgi:glutathione S-transferase
MIKIWGWIGSSNVQKVLWCCGELELEYDLEDHGWPYAGYKEAPYLALNPNGLVPTIQDGDFLLWESNSVLRYLAEKYADGKLTPSTPEMRASSNRWMDWQLTTMGPLMTPVYRALIRTAPENREPELIQTSSAAAEKGWHILDRYLSRSDYVGGESCSIGDIPLGILAHRWFNLPMEQRGLNAVRAWYNRLCQRPAYQKHIENPLI